VKRARILLADHRADLRTALRTILHETYHVVGEAEDGKATLAESQVWRPNVVLVAADLPATGGVETVRELHRLLPECQLVLYGTSGDPDVMAIAFAAGASGYVINGYDRDLLSTIHAVLRQLLEKKDGQSFRNADNWSTSWMRDDGQAERPVRRSA